MPDRFAKVTNGLFRGSFPETLELGMLKDIYGIRKVISLDDRLGNLISPLCKHLDLKQEIIGLGNGYSPNLTIIKTNTIPNILNDGPTYIHCKHGKDRTGMVVAMFRIFNGMSLEKALKEAEKFGMGKGLPKPIHDSYYEAVIDFHDELNDKNDLDDVVEVSRDLSSNPGIDNSTVTNFGRDSFAPYEDPSSPQVSVYASKKAEKIYCRCNSFKELLIPKKKWYSNIFLAKKNSNGSRLFSAFINSFAKIEECNYMNQSLLNHILSKGIDVIKFKDEIIIINPNEIENITEETEDSNNLEIGLRDNYSASSNYIAPGSGGIMGEGFAGPVFLPYNNGF